MIAKCDCHWLGRLFGARCAGQRFQSRFEIDGGMLESFLVEGPTLIQGRESRR